MSKTIDYYLSLQSPWTYLGHTRLVELAKKHNAEVAVKPVNYQEVFPATGGLPLPKRAPARQAYRMMELKRWREFLGMPLNLEPSFYPVSDKLAATLVVAIRRSDPQTALKFVGLVLKSVWADEADIADENTLRQLLQRCDADEVFASINDDDLYQEIQTDTLGAIERGVFGAPSYVVEDEIFWGQDRLEFLERKLGM